MIFPKEIKTNEEKKLYINRIGSLMNKPYLEIEEKRELKNLSVLVARWKNEYS